MVDHEFMAYAAKRIRAISHQGSFKIVPREPITPVPEPTPFQRLRQQAIYNRVRSIAP